MLGFQITNSYSHTGFSRLHEILFDFIKETDFCTLILVITFVSLSLLKQGKLLSREAKAHPRVNWGEGRGGNKSLGSEILVVRNEGYNLTHLLLGCDTTQSQKHSRMNK